MPVVSDFVFSSGVAGLWIQLVNNVTGAIFLSTAPTDAAGRATMTGVPPAGSYAFSTSIVNGPPWQLRNPNYPVATIGQADGNFPMAGPTPWFDCTHPSFAGGAKLNNAADDLPALNAAGLAAFNAGGGWVLIPNLGTGPGLFNGNIIMRTNVVWMGIGFGAALKRSGAGSFFWNNVACNGSRICNLFIDGNLQNFDLINFGNSNYCILEECQLTGAQPSGAHCKLQGGTGHIVRHNIFQGTNGGTMGSGVYIVGPTINSQVIHNYFTGIGTATGSQIANGPGVPGCNGNLIMGNICVGNNVGYGISSSIASFYVKIHSNHSSGHGISGILSNGDRCSVKGNTCLSNGLDGIDLGDSSSSVCEGNFCGLNMWHGIEVNADISNSLGLMVKGNICWANNQTNNGSDGIRVQANPSAGGLVSQCVFMGNRCFDDQGLQRQTYGIRELQGPGTVDNNLYIGNSLRGNVTSALLITGASSRSVGNLGAADNRTIQNVAFANPLVVDASLGEIVVVGTLTASTTVSAPLNPLKGQRLTFVFTQNAASGWLVSWNAVFLTSSSPWIGANASTIMTFTYDGTNWRLEGLPISSGGAGVAYATSAIISSAYMQTFGQMLVGTNLQTGTQVYPGELSTSAQQTVAGVWRVAGVPSNSNGNNSDRALQDAGVTWVKKGGVWLTETSVIVAQANPANPALTATLDPGVMMGLGQLITPNRSGKIRVTVYGDAFNSVATDGMTMQIRQGTGGAPANGGALAGTVQGNKVSATSATASAKVPFALMAVITGLALGTQIWVDVALGALVGGNASIENLTVILEEV